MMSVASPGANADRQFGALPPDCGDAKDEVVKSALGADTSDRVRPSLDWELLDGQGH